MAFHSNELKSTKTNPVHVGASLPWWTWVLPFLIANAGTWLSLWFKTNPGTALWYLPTALGIVMVYWWGPRVLIGIYLNSVVCTPLWDLPWQGAFLYALPETLEVGLSWLFFIRLAGGKYWLPDMGNVGAFQLFGSIIPTLIANTYLVAQLYFLENIPQHAIWENWQIVFSADLVTQYVLTVPLLIIFSRPMSRVGWTLTKESIPQLPFLVNNRNSRLDLLFIILIFVTALILVTQPLTRDLWILDGLLMIVIAIRYGVNMAVLGTSWIGILAYLLPIILTGQRGLPITNYAGIISTNFNILFLCGVTLITGRAISDLFTEIDNHKRSEKNLLGVEVRFRSLVEQIPPIIYTAGRDQHIGVSYISPQIKLLGFTQAEWLADPELWLRQIHPDDQKNVLADIELSKASNQPFKSEYRIQTRTGDIRWFLDEAVDVENSDSELLFRQGFMLDITERKRVEESLYARERYLELLNEMTRAILLSKDFDLTLHTLAIDMAKLIHADDCFIARWDEERQVISPVTATMDINGLDTSYRNARPEDLKMALSVLSAGHVLAADDIYNSPYINVELVKRYIGRSASALGIPLIIGEHKLGAAIIIFNTPHHFTSAEIERAEQAGNQVALALWNFQQSIEIQQRLKESNTLAKIARILGESERTGTGEVLQLIVDSARELMPHAEKSVIHI